MNKRSNIAPVAIFFASMIVIHLLTSILFNVLPFPIKPTIVHIPVIIGSIIYGPRIGAILGFLMGMISLTVNTLTILPTSYLFSPFVPNGNLYSVVIAIVPRILIGGIFFLFGNVFDGNIQKLLATVISTNSIAELIISAILTLAIVPRLEKIKQ